MHSLAGFLCLLNSGNEHGIFAKGTVLHRVFQPDIVLRHYAASTNIEMPRFRVARLSALEANGFTGGPQIAHGIVVHQRIPNRRFRNDDWVIFVRFAHTPAVEDDQ